jgi:protein-tyrosine kinase
MSRFYEALKQAGRSLQGEQENPLLELPESSAEFVDAEQSAAELPSGGLPTEVLDASAEHTIPSRPVPQNGFLGILTEGLLDEKVRSIPNAVEPMLVEHYRQLRTKIIQQQEKKPFRSLLVTSANPKEGKTLTTLNLALSFGMLPSYRVLVVDGDLRRGQLSRWLGIQDRAGLANLLAGTSRLEEVVFRSSAIPFQFMGLGTSKLPPPELVHSSRWPSRIREISEHFDLTLVDSPPANLVADAQLLAAGCDAVLLVARAFRTSRETFESVWHDFQSYRVIGTVLNGGPLTGSYRHYKGYYS